RVGYLVLPEDLAAPVERQANDTYISPAGPSSAAVHQMLLAGTIDSCLPAARAELAHRCELLCAAVEAHLPDARFVRPQGGYFLWVTLPDEVDATALATRAAANGAT